MVERPSRERRRRARPEPVGAEAPTQHCSPAATSLAVLTEEAEPTLDSGLDPVADSARAQWELQEWLEPRGAPTRPIPRPIPPTTRGRAAEVAAPDEFRKPALIIAPPNLPASERHELETAVELQLRDNWDPERGWQGYLDQRDEVARVLRPDHPVQYPQPYRGKRTRTTSDWTPEVALQIRRERVLARDHRRAMERQYERLSVRPREPEHPRHQEQQQRRQEEPMLHHDDSSKRRQRNPNRRMILEDHVDYQAPAERDYSPPPGPATLARALSVPADPLQEEIHRLAEEAARVARLEDQSPTATATSPTPERQNPAPERDVTPTSRPGPVRRGTRFQWLEPLPLDEDDPPPQTCFPCWKRGHRSAFCPAPKPWFHCFNCGRRRVAAHN
ncbi:hypothetical protein QAD02_008217 [Eretmocerus hayati]|uniref:Uncharacterized protein n=1 Tax=Eretmocerus hayati TaxID=131215 RepID=A0ACC2NA77_9HYME|nr:hypothetical protein QAD02_008217 [Eretmocerus hayati]